jgi:hydrogenase maturation protease
MRKRVLCLGNDLLADDALGPLVAQRLRLLDLPGVEVMETAETGFYLLELLLNCSSLLVVDTIVSGHFRPGTVRLLREEDVASIPGTSPHYVGLFEALAAGRQLQLSVPERVTLLVVEAGDCFTVGGAMHPAVERAIARVVEQVCALVTQPPGPRVACTVYDHEIF